MIRLDNKNQFLVWATVGSFFLGVLLAIATISGFSGRLDARVAALELQSHDTVSKAEWNVFVKDIGDRLDRIETKLDNRK